MKAAEGQMGVLCESTEAWTTELEVRFQFYAVDIRPFPGYELILRSDKLNGEMIGVAGTTLFTLLTKQRCQFAARDNNWVWAASHFSLICVSAWCPTQAITSTLHFKCIFFRLNSNVWRKTVD